MAAQTASADTDSQIFKVTIDSALDIAAPATQAVADLDAVNANTDLPQQTWRATGNVAAGVTLEFKLERFENNGNFAEGILSLATPDANSPYTVEPGTATTTATSDALRQATTTTPINDQPILVNVAMINPASPIAGDYVTTVTGTITANN